MLPPEDRDAAHPRLLNVSGRGRCCCLTRRRAAGGPITIRPRARQRRAGGRPRPRSVSDEIARPLVIAPRDLGVTLLA